jgi:hypothetical protein
MHPLKKGNSNHLTRQNNQTQTSHKKIPRPRKECLAKAKPAREVSRTAPMDCPTEIIKNSKEPYQTEATPHLTTVEKRKCSRFPAKIPMAKKSDDFL